MARPYEKSPDKRLQEVLYQLKELKKMRKESPAVKELEKEVMEEVKRRDG